MALDNEDIKQLIAILQRGLSDEIDSETQEQTPVTKKRKKQIQQKANSKKVFSSNKFLEMPESGMHKDDSRIDKLLCKQPPVSRSRSYQPVTATCRVCGRKEEVNPSLITEGAARYKCNKCSTSEG